VWRRLQRIYGLYAAGDELGSALGFGGVKFTSAEASHCNNIGPLHRGQLHEPFAPGLVFPQ
jgi:hypothetical protein